MAVFSDAVESAYAKFDASFPPASQKAYCTVVTNCNAVWYGLSVILFPGSIW